MDYDYLWRLLCSQFINLTLRLLCLHGLWYQSWKVLCTLLILSFGNFGLLVNTMVTDCRKFTNYQQFTKSLTTQCEISDITFEYFFHYLPIFLGDDWSSEKHWFDSMGKVIMSKSDESTMECFILAVKITFWTVLLLYLLNVIYIEEMDCVKEESKHPHIMLRDLFTLI
jgi:hypothetical protein